MDLKKIFTPMLTNNFYITSITCAKSEDSITRITFKYKNGEEYHLVFYFQIIPNQITINFKPSVRNELTETKAKEVKETFENFLKNNTSTKLRFLIKKSFVKYENFEINITKEIEEIVSDNEEKENILNRLFFNGQICTKYSGVYEDLREQFIYLGYKVHTSYKEPLFYIIIND